MKFTDRQRVDELIKARKRIVELEEQINGPIEVPPFSKLDIMKVGDRLGQYVDKLELAPETDDLDAFDRYIVSLRERGEQGDLWAARRYCDFEVPDTQCTMFLLYSWARHGFRQLCSSHRYAAALMTTSIPPSMLADLEPPWPCFALDLPSGLLTMQGKDGREVPLVFAIIRRGMWGENRDLVGWSFVLFGENGDEIWGYNRPLEELLKGDKLPEEARTAFTDLMTSLDERSELLFWRYCVGLILAMQDRSNIKETKSSKSQHNHRLSKEPVCRTYIIGKMPALDCRPAVRQFLSGERPHGPVNVQTLVSGHWKQQPYGPQASLRKTIWLEPYWRGPDDAPILVKPVAVSPAPEERETT